MTINMLTKPRLNALIKATLFISIFVLLSYNLAGQVNSHIPFNVTQYTLDNGLTVILSEDHVKPVVFGAVIVKAGGKNDPEDATGMAHYQEHMLFKGNEDLGTINREAEKPYIDSIFLMYDKLDVTKDEAERNKIQAKINQLSLEANKYAIPNELSNIIKEYGGTNLNAGTAPDETVFYNSFPPDRIEQWLEIYSHRFVNPVFRSFQAELEVVYEEKNLYNDNFIMPLFEKFQSKFFKKHPYGQQTIIGTVEDLKNPSLTKMLEFFNTWYVPNNMALILCGDFNTQEVIPMIKSKFGTWKKKDLPALKTWEETPFKGKEVVNVRMSPVKIGILGYRIPPAAHNDNIAIRVMSGILTNQNSSGLLDKLVIDNKILAAQCIPMEYNDYGAGMILIIPKIIGQSLEKAEALVLNEINKIKKGEFEDWLLEASKNNLYTEHITSIENVTGKALLLASSFSRKTNILEELKYPEKIKAVTKEDVVRVANLYFGDNYLAFYSKMGFPKKEKIDKPNYKPVLSNVEAKSAFALKLDSIPKKANKEVYFDFNKDITDKEIGNGHRIICVNNPYNDIFSLTIKYKVGNYRMPMLQYASGIMNLAGTKTYDVNKLKQKFSTFGCAYDISSNDNFLEINLHGIESNLDSALILLKDLITNPVIEKSKIDMLVDAEKTNRKIEKSEVDQVADALFEYVKYGNKSKYIDRLTIKEIAKLNTDTLINVFKSANKKEAEILYCGNRKPDEISGLVTSLSILNPSPEKGLSPEDIPVIPVTENLVYLVNKKNALQSKVYFIISGQPYEIKDDAAINAFNLYFAGDFSGLVLQEIREYRSLAYNAGAVYDIPERCGSPGIFYGYVGTQADKTITALEVFDSLVRYMPVKEERLNMLKEYLISAELSDRPSFRELGSNYLKWKTKGYTEDPAKSLVNNYRNLDFNLITGFYNKSIKNQKMAIAITGDIKRINIEQLKRFGKVKIIKEKELFRN